MNISYFNIYEKYHIIFIDVIVHKAYVFHLLIAILLFFVDLSAKTSLSLYFYSLLLISLQSHFGFQAISLNVFFLDVNNQIFFLYFNILIIFILFSIFGQFYHVEQYQFLYLLYLIDNLMIIFVKITDLFYFFIQ